MMVVPVPVIGPAGLPPAIDATAQPAGAALAKENKKSFC